MKRRSIKLQTSILVSIYTELQAHVRSNEVFENKVAFSVIGVLLVFSGFDLRGEVHFDSNQAWVVIAFILLVVLFATWFLMKIQARIRRTCEMLVRVEKSMGLYEPKAYWSSPATAAGEVEIPETVYPYVAASWGSSDDLLYSRPHIMGILCAGFIAIASIFVTHALWENIHLA